ncbi:MAG TPA: MBL fold metallo-hydrolase, partial [Candidatus Sulfotelmatobacter sp.]|nr:MBL fold metallo-hydrolase [Candidatus Sulfotelmatobacter sp.]
MSTWQFGNVRVDRVLEFERPVLPPAHLFPTSTPEAIDRHRGWLEPRLLDPQSGLLAGAFHSFVIRSEGRTILVDTCSGNDKPRPQKLRYHLNRWPYLERLAAAGVTPAEVHFVVCTHLHVDHVGWNTRLVDGRWVPTFPNAKYLFARSEWEYWSEQYKTPAFVD